MSIFETAIQSLINKHLTTIEMSFVSRIISYDKVKMTAEIKPLLKIETPGSVEKFIESQNIKDVRVERIPGIRPIYINGDLVKCELSASPIDEPIENQRSQDILGVRFSLSYVTIKGKLKSKAFSPPGQYGSEDGLILNDDENFYISFKGDQVYIKGKTVIDGTEEVKGNSRSLVTHAELDTVLQSYNTAINAKFATKQDAPGTPGGLSIDISSAKTDNIKTGAG